MKFYKLLIISIVLLLTDARLSFGETDSEGTPSVVLGITVAELTKRFGSPDKKVSVDKELRELWLYGESVVMITSGKVTGVSDTGELQDRAVLSELKEEASQIDNFKGSGFVNAWTPAKPVRAGEVLSEILGLEKENQKAED